MRLFELAAQHALSYNATAALVAVAVAFGSFTVLFVCACAVCMLCDDKGAASAHVCSWSLPYLQSLGLLKVALHNGIFASCIQVAALIEVGCCGYVMFVPCPCHDSASTTLFASGGQLWLTVNMLACAVRCLCVLAEWCVP
jgi:hypothetical protein